MRVLITAGGTTEYIDDVRVLTNISTGKLGAMIAHALAVVSPMPPRQYQQNAPRTHSITYICPKSAKLPAQNDWFGAALGNIRFVFVTDVASLMKVMEEEVPKHDVVIHAMAVSDFGFRRDGAVKLKSNDPAGFIEYMRQNIQTNPKVISYIKEWNPNCKLIGFKFEVGKRYTELADLADDSMRRNKCDVVIANDKEEMNREQEHIAYWFDGQPHPDTTHPNPVRLFGKEAITERLVAYIGSLEQNPYGSNERYPRGWHPDDEKRG